jgi:hypothetical protein
VIEGEAYNLMLFVKYAQTTGIMGDFGQKNRFQSGLGKLGDFALVECPIHVISVLVSVTRGSSERPLVGVRRLREGSNRREKRSAEWIVQFKVGDAIAARNW